MLLRYILKRLLWMVPFLFAVSVVAFLLIQAPPGDYLTTYIAKLGESNEVLDQASIENLRERFGLDRPLYVQYFKWVWNLLQGDFGMSFEWRQPVSDLVWERMGLTITLSFATLLFTWAVAFPIGVYSAVHKYSIGDYIATTLGFIGLATPNFLLALILMYIGVVHFGADVGGLFSNEYKNAPWSFAKVMDLMQHLWLPIIVLGTSATASLIRIMRANLLDELNKPYVDTARAKGLSEFWLIMKYPVRVALNPFISTIGWVLPQLVSGAVVTAIVLSLPTAGPLMLQSLLAQDMYLAGAFVLLLSSLTVVGMLISDILLVLLDPRVKYD
ncbi:ABC transporter permease [Psychromarinibacter sp. C21-152]|uniref:ABC transporter permease n=1 Tax=Psychromarinibacter sediminicola TaxID=3033385 RepID=A0AAE3NT18_9RHOB|nr:ABC transporter permease [Psychromarinibacter sediminicola]MDF0603783.1 ABC transporter permease [Psychromarinibacter sediminicola]